MTSLESIEIPPKLRDSVSPTARLRHRACNRALGERVDGLFGIAMLVQWAVAITSSCFFVPLSSSWISSTSPPSPLWIAIAGGGTLAGVVWTLVLMRRGKDENRFVIAIAQMAMTFLIIDFSGGRAPSYFLLFASLTLLTLYRDWRVLSVATFSVGIALAFFSRMEIPSPVQGMPWSVSLWLETMAWILLENLVLTIAVLQFQQEQVYQADQWALLTATKDVVESEVQRKTAELARSEAELQSTAQRLLAIINTSFDAFVEIDEELRITQWSRRAEELLGWPTEEVIGHCFHKVIGGPELHMALTKANYFQSQPDEHTEPLLIETVVYTADGRKITTEAYGTLSDRQGKKHFNMFLRDLTARIARTEKELQAQKLESLGQLATGIAHEINSPTQFVSDNLMFLDDSFRFIDRLIERVETVVENLDDTTTSQPEIAELRQELLGRKLLHVKHEIPKAIQQSRDGMDRISSITMAMKEFSHPSNQAMATVELSRIIENAILVCRNEWRYVADVTTDFSEEISTVCCQPGPLSQAVLNLVVNASHAIADILSSYPESRGTINVRTRLVGASIEIDVSDNGPGIPLANRDKIFDPNFTTKAVGKGTGQGLAIVQSVAHKHKGHVRLHSEPGVGTTFTICIPASSQTHEQVELF